MTAPAVCSEADVLEALATVADPELDEPIGDVRVDAPGEKRVQPIPGQARITTGTHRGEQRT